MKKLLIVFSILLSSGLVAQEKPWTAGFNLHKLGFRSPQYAGFENLRLGYWFHDYHQAGLEAGMLRSGNGINNPVAGFYYRFTPGDNRFHMFFEGHSKIWFQRNIVSGNTRDALFAGYVGFNFEITEQLSVEAAIGRISIDWDQYLGINFRF